MKARISGVSIELDSIDLNPRAFLVAIQEAEALYDYALKAAKDAELNLELAKMARENAEHRLLALKAVRF